MASAIEGAAISPTQESNKYIIFDTSTSVAKLVLNHPKFNVLTVPMMTEIAVAIESLSSRSDIKAIVLSSSQEMFSAGISLEDSKADRVFQTLDAFTRVFQAIREISKPLIVVVNGPAIGAGSELVAFGDMIIATPKAKFAQPEVKRDAACHDRPEKDVRAHPHR
jgi:cyclohexa-1,5-dienecarbonyl-CoA hydratase